MTTKSVAFLRARPHRPSSLPCRMAAGVHRQLERRPVDKNCHPPLFRYVGINCRRRPMSSAVGRYYVASRTWVTGRPICWVYCRRRWISPTIDTNMIPISWRTFSVIWVLIPRSTSEYLGHRNSIIILWDDI